MSPIGRIFIVLNLVLSAFFLGWASTALSTTENWKEKHAEATQAMADAVAAKDAEISGLTIEKNDASEAHRKFREERDQIKTLADNLQGQFDAEKRRNDTMQGELVKIQSSLGDYNTTIATLSGDKDRAVQRANDAENARDDAVQAQQDAELAKRDAAEGLVAANTSIGDLKVANTSLEDQVSTLNTRLLVLADVTGTNIEDIMVQPQIEGAVLDVRYDLSPGLVMLNVGSDNDVQRGFTFEIYRGSTYKGKVRVENVQGKYCSAVIIDAKAGTTIAQGDRAATNL
jgi:hypothetical protein